MAEQDTLRLLLQNKFDRIENLVQMNHAATLAIPTILATIWGIEGGLDNFRNAWVLSIISIGLLLIWRYFAHYLDDDIVKTYIEIVKIENRVHISLKITLFNNLIDLFQNSRICSPKDPDEKLFQFIKALAPEKRVAFLKCLVHDKKMGTRGHNDWDRIATILSVIFFLVIILNLGIISLLAGFIILLSYLYVMNSGNFQEDPTIDVLKDTLNKIDCPYQKS